MHLKLFSLMLHKIPVSKYLTSFHLNKHAGDEATLIIMPLSPCSTRGLPHPRVCSCIRMSFREDTCACLLLTRAVGWLSVCEPVSMSVRKDSEGRTSLREMISIP